MMANAQRMIEERKKALNALKGDDKSVKAAIPPPSIAVPAVKNAPADLEKARKIAQLQVYRFSPTMGLLSFLLLYLSAVFCL